MTRISRRRFACKGLAVIDQKGFRAGVALILVNDERKVFLAKRIGQDGWQFPQGGISEGENPEQAMYRELKEEIGLTPDDVELLACSKDWLRYRLPRQMIRYGSRPLCVGQRQRWFLLRLKGSDSHIRFDLTDSPEFDGFRWVHYWYPLRRVISFKKNMYRRVLHEFSAVLFPKKLDSQAAESIES